MHNDHPLQLWLARTDQFSFAKLWDKHSLCLPQQEQEKVLSYKFEKDRILSLVSKVMLRTMLSSRFPDRALQSWRFATNRYGKPFMEANNKITQLHFNLSHTDGLVACIMSTAGDVGVDVEVINNRETILEIAPTVFTSNEIALLNLSSDRNEEIHNFYRLWTLKEAYIKCMGKGLSIPLQDFEFTVQDGKIAFKAIDIELAQKTPSFLSMRFRPRHMLSIAIQSTHANRIAIDARDFSDLECARKTDIKFDLSSVSDLF